MYVTVFVEVLPFKSLELTVNEWTPSVAVSMGVPLATEPVQVANPVPFAPSLQA